MQLHQIQAEEPIPIYAAPLTGPPHLTAITSKREEPRYDTAAVQKILVLAQEIQTTHRETLTPDDIEALGQEIGLEPEFVRRAALQWESQDRQPLQRPSTATRRRKVASLIPFPLYLMTAALLLKWGSSLAPTTPTHNSHHRHTTEATTPLLYGVIYFGFLLALPAILAFCTGFQQKSKRGGAKIGALYGLAPLLSVALFALYTAVTQSAGHSNTLLQEILWGSILFGLVLGTWLGMGALFGVGGFVTRQKISRLRHKKRNRETA